MKFDLCVPGMQTKPALLRSVSSSRISLGMERWYHGIISEQGNANMTGEKGVARNSVGMGAILPIDIRISAPLPLDAVKAGSGKSKATKSWEVVSRLAPKSYRGAVPVGGVGVFCITLHYANLAERGYFPSTSDILNRSFYRPL